MKINDIKIELRNIIKKYVGTEIGDQDSFMEYSVDSITIVKILDEIDMIYPDILSITDMFEHVNINELSEYIYEQIHQ